MYPGDRIVIYKPEDLAELDLAYAVTIHQAQGSEWPVVLLPIANSHNLSRNLLYTAISRGKELVIVAGKKSVLADGMRRECRRRSLLTERIQEKMEHRAWREAHTNAPAAGELPRLLAS